MASKAFPYDCVRVTVDNEGLLTETICVIDRASWGDFVHEITDGCANDVFIAVDFQLVAFDDAISEVIDRVCEYTQTWMARTARDYSDYVVPVEDNPRVCFDNINSDEMSRTLAVMYWNLWAFAQLRNAGYDV